jgi:hypothetical protein
MPEINKIKCWLEDGDTGERLPEYQTREKKKSASAIVISEEVKPFSINFSGAVNDTCVGVSIGGKRLENVAYARDAPKGQMRMLGLQNSEVMYSPWTFSHNQFEGTWFLFQTHSSRGFRR